MKFFTKLLSIQDTRPGPLRLSLSFSDEPSAAFLRQQVESKGNMPFYILTATLQPGELYRDSIDDAVI